MAILKIERSISRVHFMKNESSLTFVSSFKKEKKEREREENNKKRSFGMEKMVDKDS